MAWSVPATALQLSQDPSFVATPPWLDNKSRSVQESSTLLHVISSQIFPQVSLSFCFAVTAHSNTATYNIFRERHSAEYRLLLLELQTQIHAKVRNHGEVLYQY